MPETRGLSILLEETLADDFDAFCTEYSYKKSTFVANLLKEFLRKECYLKQILILWK